MTVPARTVVQRLKGDTYVESWSVRPMPGDASFLLTIEGVDSVVGAPDHSAQTVDFAVNATIADTVVGSYDFQVVMTTAGTTRTIVQGTWTIVARSTT